MNRYQLKGVCSEACLDIEQQLMKWPEIKEANINRLEMILEVQGSNMKTSKITKLVKKISPKAVVSPIKEADDFSCSDGSCGGQERESAEVYFLKKLLIVSAVILAIGLVIDYKIGIPLGLQYIVFGVPYLLCGRSVLLTAGRNILKGQFFNEFTLMSGATLAAMAIGFAPEALGVMLFYQVGEMVQYRATQNSRRSIKNLLATKPNQALVLEGEKTISLNVEEVKKGQIFLVKPGEQIPLDGIVLSGLAQVDTSPLTGEPVPITVKEGSHVFGGTISQDGSLTVKALGGFKDSKLSEVLTMVEEATANKSEVERFITRFSRYYTPIVFALAVLVFLIPTLFFAQPFKMWLYRALVLLVISCPCALVLSIPLSYFGGIGAAAKRGLLVKGGTVFDALRDLKVIAFDKTGTLTEGVFEITTINPAEGVSEDELIYAAKIAEKPSNHPIAKSIANFPLSPTNTIEFSELSSQELAGRGIVTNYQGLRYLAGNAKLMEEFDLIALPVLNPGTVVHIASENHYLGFVIVSDKLKKEAFKAIKGLKNQGFKCLMLTGDRPEGAKWVAEELDLDFYRAGLLPDEKVAALKEFSNPEKTMFVGDGINDAPLLAAAKVSVAMGKLGSAVAVEIADVVILNDSPAKILELLGVSKHTRNIVWQNIVLALGIKTIFMALGVVGVAGLWEAVFADVGVAVLATLNAARGPRKILN